MDIQHVQLWVETYVIPQLYELVLTLTHLLYYFLWTLGAKSQYSASQLEPSRELNRSPLTPEECTDKPYPSLSPARTASDFDWCLDARGLGNGSH